MDDNELLKTVEPVYFEEENQFNLDHITNNLPENLTSEYFSEYKERLQKLLNVISRKVSEHILQNQPVYVDELQRIANLRESVAESLKVCRQGRSCLRYIKDGTLKNGSTIVRHYRRRQALAKLLEYLTAISDLRKTVVIIRSIIDTRDDFTRAIELCHQSRGQFANLDKFTSINDMKQKLGILILNQDFIGYRFDEFIKILGIVDLIVQLGNEFCNQPSTLSHRDCINTQLSHFNAYHKTSLDELKMFLESELWEAVPVKSDFKLAHLKEFAFLREISGSNLSNYNRSKSTKEEVKSIEDAESIPGAVISDTSSKPTPHGQAGKDTQGSCLDQLATLPTDRISLSSDSEVTDYDDDDDLNLELHKDCVKEDEFVSSDEADEGTQPTRKTQQFGGGSVVSSSTDAGSHTRFLLTRSSGPVLTNSSLNVLRLIGRYTQMMQVLSPISYEILMKIYNILDYYTMFVYKKFGPESDKKIDDKNLSPKLTLVIRSIRESLIGHQITNLPGDIRSILPIVAQHNEASLPQLPIPQRRPNIGEVIARELDQPAQQCNSPCDPKKAVAIESLIFIVNQLWNLQEYLESLIPAEMQPQLRAQFSQSHSVVPDFLKARAEMSSDGMFNKNC